jgi:hypothetical protein
LPPLIQAHCGLIPLALSQPLRPFGMWNHAARDSRGRRFAASPFVDQRSPHGRRYPFHRFFPEHPLLSTISESYSIPEKAKGPPQKPGRPLAVDDRVSIS